MATMPETVQKADAAGLQINIHAIGDRANAEVLDIFAKTEQANGVRDRRFRIEHAQHLRLDDIKRFGGQKVVASMQPFHIIDDGRWAWNGSMESGSRTYMLSGQYWTPAAFSLRIRFAGCSAESYLGRLWLTRRTLDDKNPNGWIPEQKISVEETVRAFTWGSAYGEFQDHIKGTLAVGKLADFVVLSEDLFTIDPVKIWNVKVMKTVVNGKLVYEAK